MDTTNCVSLACGVFSIPAKFDTACRYLDYLSCSYSKLIQSSFRVLLSYPAQTLRSASGLFWYHASTLRKNYTMWMNRSYSSGAWHFEMVRHYFCVLLSPSLAFEFVVSFWIEDSGKIRAPCLSSRIIRCLRRLFEKSVDQVILAANMCFPVGSRFQSGHCGCKRRLLMNQILNETAALWNGDSGTYAGQQRFARVTQTFL